MEELSFPRYMPLASLTIQSLVLQNTEGVHPKHTFMGWRAQREQPVSGSQELSRWQLQLFLSTYGMPKLKNVQGPRPRWGRLACSLHTSCRLF